MKATVMEVVADHFRPEFINRIDDTVVFHPLGQSHIKSIGKIQLKHLKSRLNEQEMEFAITDAALDRIAEAGFDSVFGARPLKRAIQQEIENPLAQLLLAGKFVRNDKVVVDVKNDKLTFLKAQAD